ncbi:MAG: AAA-like domain-containing protein [SAR324 cluster bacterium]|nr:AAA-like domain-containing protein [SAR324 cluster bacterium]
MERFFNTAGPNIPEDHYHIPSLERVDWEEIQRLIAQKRYFLLHAPRQTGKTSVLLEMMEALNAQGRYHALYVNIEAAQTVRNDADKGMRIVCEAIAASARVYKVEPGLRADVRALLAEDQPQGVLTQFLAQWAELSEKPIVLFLDEVDALVGDTLISLLRQIRAGYAQRPQVFPQSLVLCGLRDIQDYRIHRSDGEIITGGSAFNIKAKSLRLGNFSAAEVRGLFEQHSAATGQSFDEAIFTELWQDTCGQPWLVNALGHELIWEDRSARDRNTPISLEQYWAARERLIESRATHLDQLADKLQEPRVHRVVAPLLHGDSDQLEAGAQDFQYVIDLGLIDRTVNKQVRISNRIYQEIIPRELNSAAQSMMVVPETPWFVDPDGRLNFHKLLEAFQQFFRENSESWLERFDYKEAGPQLLMQAFLQRVINGGGRISREYGLGRRRTDLAVEWPLQRLPVSSEKEKSGVEGEPNWHGPIQRIVIELKLLRGSLDSVIKKGLEQTAAYADAYKADEAHLVIFNRDPDVGWDKKIWRQNRQCANRTIGVWGA